MSAGRTLRPILVTGGAGFMGSHFVEHLFRNSPDCKILLLDALTYAGKLDSISDDVKRSPRFEFWHGNVCNDELVNTLVAQADIVVHLAAESHVARSIFDNKVFFETDVLGTQSVANAVVKNYATVKRFIHVSSSEVYGTATEIPMHEQHPLNPRTPYASAKAGADRLVYSYCETYDVPAVIVRPFNNYGPRQHLEKVIPRFVTRALRDKPLTVHGTGTSTRDWLYVGDFCKALHCAMHVDLDRVRGRVINVGTGQEHDILGLARRVLSKLGKAEDLIEFIGERPGQVDRQCASTQCAHELLDWHAETHLDEGLTETIEWYARNREWWKEQTWMETVQIRTKTGEVEHH
jgi:dTDP-glucose 4,6-dehydratase